jgi:hypothetical protein
LSPERHDLDKLEAYSRVKTAIAIDIFGPGRVIEKGVWIGGRPEYDVVQNTLYVFVLLARRNKMLDRQNLSHPIIGQQNFMLISGCTEPAAEAFTVQ